MRMCLIYLDQRRSSLYASPLCVWDLNLLSSFDRIWQYRSVTVCMTDCDQLLSTAHVTHACVHGSPIPKRCTSWWKLASRIAQRQHRIWPGSKKTSYLTCLCPSSVVRPSKASAQYFLVTHSTLYFLLPEYLKFDFFQANFKYLFY
jgi:hypothetical protein